MKAERAATHHLGREPRTVLSVPVEDGLPVSTQATLYVGLSTRSPSVIGVRLVAGLMGHRDPVGAAGIPPGFDGIAIIASGIVADSWHVEAWDNPPPGNPLASDLKLSVALGIRQCCSSPGVLVPVDLQYELPNLPSSQAAGDPSPVLPFGREQGSYRMIYSPGPGPTVIAFNQSERVLRIVCHAPDGGNATVNLGAAIQNWIIPAGTQQEARPNGNWGRSALTANNYDYLTVELVR